MAENEKEENKAIICRSGADGSLLESDPDGFEKLGVDLSRLHGEKWINLVTEQERDRVSRICHPGQDFVLLFQVEPSCTKENRDDVWLFVIGTAIEGKPEWELVFFDGLEKYKLKKSMGQMESDYCLSPNEGLWHWDMTKDYLVHSANARRMLGLEDDEFDTLADFARLVHPDDALVFSKAIEQHLTIDKPFDITIRIRSRTGLYCYVRSRGCVARATDHKPTHMRGTLTDMTEIHELQDRLAAARDELTRALKIKEDFMGNISHELRTPLNHILGTVQVLMDTTLNSEQEELACTIGSSAQTLLRMTDDIIDYVMLNAGQLPIQVITANLDDILADVVGEFREQATKRGVALTLSVEDELRYVRTDPHRLRQIAHNLISNAVKFTPRGSVHVKAHAVKREGNTAIVALVVADTGIGVPSDYIAHLFDTFSQVDTRTTRRFGGVGLGLALTRQLTHALGGEIEVQSEIGKGSTFTVTLPLELVQGPGASAIVDMHNMRALVVMPSTTPERGRLIYALNVFGMSVDVCDTADEAIPLLRASHVFRFVFVDTVVPRSLAKALPSRTQVVAIVPPATRSTTAAEVSAPSAEPDATVVAPIRKSSLLSTLQALLRGLQFRAQHRTADTPARDALTAENADLLAPRVSIDSCPVSPGESTDSQPFEFPSTANSPQQSALADLPPRAIGGLAALNEVAERSATTACSEPAQTDPASIRVLIAEDNIPNQKVALRMLQKLGFLPDVANDGREAVALHQRRRYDVIFMDCHMPEMDGYEATRHIREFDDADDGSRPLIIAMTADVLPGNRKRCMEVGMDDFFGKPIQLQTLSNILCRAGVLYKAQAG